MKLASFSITKWLDLSRLGQKRKGRWGIDWWNGEGGMQKVQRLEFSLIGEIPFVVIA